MYMEIRVPFVHNLIGRESRVFPRRICLDCRGWLLLFPNEVEVPSDRLYEFSLDDLRALNRTLQERIIA